MDRTHITHRLKHVIATHGYMLEALAVSAALSTILMAEDVAPSAHFLQRMPTQRQEAASSAMPVRARPKTKAAVRTMEDRAALRRAQRVVTRRTNVADAGNASYIATNEPVRPAASAEPVAAASASSTAPADFPAFGRAMHPVSSVPDWGAMTTPAQWNRTYGQLDDADFVRTPAYDLDTLTLPMNLLLKNRYEPASIRALTAKLYYSTRFFGAYDLDSGEFGAVHPGIDLKLAEDTPVGAVAGGRVHDVRDNPRSLGIHVLIEHRAPDGQTYYSIYGHLDRATVRTGDAVEAGQTIGTVGMTGHTTGPHLHLQIDRGEPESLHHEVYWPESIPSRSEANARTVNPAHFIRQYGAGN